MVQPRAGGTAELRDVGGQCHAVLRKVPWPLREESEMDIAHEEWHQDWMAGLGRVLATPEDLPPLPETPGGQRPAIRLTPRPGVRAEVEIPPEAPGGAAVMAVHEACETPPADYPGDQVFFPWQPFRVTRFAGGRVTTQIMELANLEESADLAVAQCQGTGWKLEDRSSKERSVGPTVVLNILLTFSRQGERRDIAVAGMGDQRFLVAEDVGAQGA